MMVTVEQVLAFVGIFIVVVLTCWIPYLQDLFERVKSLEVNDDVRRDDIIDLKSQIMHIMDKINGGDDNDGLDT